MFTHTQLRMDWYIWYIRNKVNVSLQIWQEASSVFMVQLLGYTYQCVVLKVYNSCDNIMTPITVEPHYYEHQINKLFRIMITIQFPCRVNNTSVLQIDILKSGEF